MAVLTPELRAWIVPGLAGTIATVTPSLRPQMGRVWAARADSARDVIEVYALRSHLPTLLEAQRTGSRIALSLADAATYGSRMFKGTFSISPHEPEPAVLEESLAAFDRVVTALGLAADTAERMVAHDEAPRSLVALAITVERVFDQSPKPGAGAPL